jgi:hypothetical protein
MGQVYLQATLVLVWLGPDSEKEAEEAFGAFKRLYETRRDLE